MQIKQHVAGSFLGGNGEAVRYSEIYYKECDNSESENKAPSNPMKI